LPHSSRDQNWISSKRYSFSSELQTACPGEMLSLYSANLASPNWPPAARLIWSKGRCLAQSCSNLPGNKRSLRRNAALAWSLEDRSKPRPNSLVLSPNTRRGAGGLFNTTRSDGGALSLWTMEMVRERSSVVLRQNQ